MAQIKPYPLYPAQNELVNMDLRDYEELVSWLSDGPEWWQQSWSWGQQFLKFIARNKSVHTYIRFRSEIEKLLLWTFLVADKPVDSLKKVDVLDYSEFFYKPPVHWICLNNHEKFSFVNGAFVRNPSWAPFRFVSQSKEPTEADKKKYRPSLQSMNAMFTAIVAFYKYLMDEEACYGNPAQLAKKDCKRLVKDAQVKDVKRLSPDQWDLLLLTAKEMADEDPLYERNLFLLAALKTLFLRISELSERPDWIPVMSHFWSDNQDNWWLKIFGKGRKIRDITVPDEFLGYLRRYRQHRGLPGLPGKREQEPIIEKIRGAGGMTSRQLARLVDAVIDQTFDVVRQQSGYEEAQIFKDMTTHWLRHTGASIEIDRGRALKDVSEDLGHSSMATTDTIYVQTDQKQRAASGKNRSV